MKPTALTLTIIMLLSASPSGAVQEKSKPPKIFTTENVIEATLEGPWKAIDRSREDQDWPGKFTYTGANGDRMSIPVQISLRGLTRRRVCDFPPLRIDFDKEASKGTEFRGAGNLKLVTHCFRNTRYAQYYIKEFLAYGIYNLVTPLSYQVQGLDLSYIESDNPGKPIQRFGFLIEDPDDVAERNGLIKLGRASTTPSQLDAEETSRFMLFQYMVANLDWSALSGPEGKCCHNARLVGEAEDTETVFAIPYDLDASGLVDTHYAAPPANLRIRDVRQRLYRGFCAHNAAVPGVLNEYRALEADIMALFENEPRLDDRQRKYATRFLAGFYGSLENDKEVQKQLIDNCRG